MSDVNSSLFFAPDSWSNLYANVVLSMALLVFIFPIVPAVGAVMLIGMPGFYWRAVRRLKESSNEQVLND